MTIKKNPCFPHLEIKHTLLAYFQEFSIFFINFTEIVTEETHHKLFLHCKKLLPHIRELQETKEMACSSFLHWLGFNYHTYGRQRHNSSKSYFVYSGHLMPLYRVEASSGTEVKYEHWLPLQTIGSVVKRNPGVSFALWPHCGRLYPASFSYTIISRIFRETRQFALRIRCSETLSLHFRDKYYFWSNICIFPFGISLLGLQLSLVSTKLL